MNKEEVSSEQLQAICAEALEQVNATGNTQHEDTGNGYRATFNQILFFLTAETLRVIPGRGSSIETAADIFSNVEAQELLKWAHNIAKNLNDGDSGEFVSKLQTKDPKALEKLRILCKTVILVRRKTVTITEEDFEELIQEGMLRLWKLVTEMIAAEHIDESQSPLQYAYENKLRLRGHYNFTTKYTTYTSTVVRNRTLDLLQRFTQIFNKQMVYEDEHIDIPNQVSGLDGLPQLVPVEGFDEMERILNLLHHLIENELTAKPKKIMYLSLASSTDFLDLIHKYKFAIGSALANLPCCESDDEIAKFIKSTAGSVAAQRSQAFNKLVGIEPALEGVFKHFIGGRKR